MLKGFLSTLREQASNDQDETRRRHPRREIDRCVIDVCGQTFPIENWSPGGVLVAGDERLFGLGQDVEFSLKFKLRNTILDVKHRGHVVRKNNQKVAIKFEPVTQTIRRTFQQVIDDCIAGEFANSQATS